MKNYRPVLLENLGLSVPGLRVHRLRLNHHTPEPVWTLHSHDHSQLLVYLSGRGSQQLGGRHCDCRPGTVIHVSAGTMHAFARQMQRAPLVLVIDADLETSRATPHPVAQMPESDLTRVRSTVSRLLAMREAGHREAMLRVNALVLEMLDRILLAAGWLKPFNRFGDARAQALTKFTERLLERMDGPDTALEQIARRAGYEVEQLNRKLKNECGLTLGQMRSRLRLQRAQLLIRKGYPMQTVGEKIGLPDNNYFSRWFRQQTGMTPSQWKRRPSDPVRL